jgi:hypothetical protein
LITRIAPKIEECHGGPSLEHFMVIPEMKNSTPSLSTCNGFSLHLNKETYVSSRNMLRGKISFQDKDSIFLV